MNMYDDYDGYDHLCPECRELVTRALGVINRLENDPWVPASERALAWLDEVCGGREAVLRLDAAPLSLPRVPVPADAVEAGRIAECSAHIAQVTARFFDAEMSAACQHALVLLWRDAPQAVSAAASPEALAAGIVWTVSEVNGLVGEGLVTARSLKEALGVRRYPSHYAAAVRAGLRGLWVWSEPRSGAWSAPRWDAPARLGELGHVELLLATTRAQLIRVRDRAVGERPGETERPFYRAG